jgi:hypothetical protein
MPRQQAWRATRRAADAAEQQAASQLSLRLPGGAPPPYVAARLSAACTLDGGERERMTSHATTLPRAAFRRVVFVIMLVLKLLRRQLLLDSRTQS